MTLGLHTGLLVNISIGNAMKNHHVELANELQTRNSLLSLQDLDDLHHHFDLWGVHISVVHGLPDNLDFSAALIAFDFKKMGFADLEGRLRQAYLDSI